jgi:hypothetical protein
MLGDLLEDTTYIVCAQAVLFSNKPVAKKSRNHPFYVQRAFLRSPKRVWSDILQFLLEQISHRFIRNRVTKYSLKPQK